LRLGFGEFVLDTEARQLFRAGEEVRLQPKAFELLALLVCSRPKALSKQAIRGQLWPDVVVGDASLTVAVAELRAALGDDAKEPRYVRTVYGFGYAFAAEASVESASAGGTSLARVADRSDSPRLVWGRRVIPLLEGENVIGREEGVTVRVDAPGVSRRHARIVVTGPSATLEDLGSKNGTFLEGAADPLCAPVRLEDGTQLRLGHWLQLTFRNSCESHTTVTELS
jgi:DNA-binding winged helix-turn-helix (wHTH) protein